MIQELGIPPDQAIAGKFASSEWMCTHLFVFICVPVSCSMFDGKYIRLNLNNDSSNIWLIMIIVIIFIRKSIKVYIRKWSWYFPLWPSPREQILVLYPQTSTAREATSRNARTTWPTFGGHPGFRARPQPLPRPPPSVRRRHQSKEASLLCKREVGEPRVGTEAGRLC